MVRIVVVALAAVVLVGLVSMVVLVAHHIDPAEVALIAAPTNTALGGLGAVLVSTRTGRNR